MAITAPVNTSLEEPPDLPYTPGSARRIRIAVLIDGDRYGQGAQAIKHARFLDEFEHQAGFAGVGDMMLHGVRRLICVIGAWRPDPREWKAHFRANPLTFVMRSSQSRRWLAGLPSPPDMVLQVGTLSRPSRRGGLPYALYLDFTSALTRREWPLRGPMTGVERWLWQRLESATYRDAVVIFCRSEHVANSLREDYHVPPAKIHVVGAGVNLPLPDLQRMPPRSAPRALFVGSDFRRKGGDLLLEAWPAVRRRIPNAELTIFGRTRDSAPPGVTILPALWDRDMVNAALSETSVFVMPSRCETWGDVFLEAMAYGLPCIGTYADAMPEIIVQGQTGFLVPLNDSEALADRLITLLSDSELRHAMGRAGRARVEERFLWEPVVRRMYAVLQQAINSPDVTRRGGIAASPPRSRRLRVLQVIDSLTLGGAEQLLVTLARHIDPSRYDLRVCSLKPFDENSPIVRDLRALGTPLYTLGGTRLRNPIHVVKLARLIRLRNIDVVHTHLGSANTMGSAAAALARRPVVSTLHNIRDVYPRFGPIKQSLQNQALRWCARAIIACAPEVREVGIRDLHLPAHKLLDVPNGIDTAAYIADPTAIEACRVDALAGLPGPLVVAVGNLRPAKGHEYLIEAAADLRDHLPGLRVLIAGRSDPHEDYLRARITALNLENHVTLAGQRDDVPALLGAADLFVQSSILEGLPLSLLEAMAAGVPVVATAVGGMPRLVKDGVTGRLVPPDDSVALAAAMLDLLRSPERARRMANNAQDQVRRTYGVRVWADRLEHIYDEITMTHRRGVHSGTTR